jgi:hypothetical protein
MGPVGVECLCVERAEAEAILSKDSVKTWKTGFCWRGIRSPTRRKGVDISGRKDPLAIQGSEEAMKFGSSEVGGLPPYNYRTTRSPAAGNLSV